NQRWLSRRNDSNRKLSDHHWIASIQRNVLDLLRGDALARHAVCNVNQRRSFRYADLLSNLSHFEFEIENRMIARRQLNSTPEVRTETSQHGGHLIFAGSQKGNAEVTGFVGDCRRFHSSSDFRGCNGYAG